MAGQAGPKTRVYVEVGTKRAFASAADWPGWSRSGTDERSALENLAAYAPRYARVARLAKLDLPDGATSFSVVERVKGDSTTDYGAPHIPARDESRLRSEAETERLLALLDASWRYLDQVRAKAPAELVKGPRGGGRDREKMYDHVLGAESAYGSAVGVRQRQPDSRDVDAVKAFRKALRAGLRDASPGTKWPVPYAIRRTAWHALDHAWEMEDRIP